MNKIFVLTFIALTLNNPALVIAQKKIKEGKATFAFTYPGEEVTDPDYEGKVRKVVVQFKNGASRVESQGGNNSISITNPPKNLYILLKGKLALTRTTDDIRKNLEQFYGDTTAQITNETKTIAGYQCTRAIYPFTGTDKEARQFEIWFTKDIKAANFDFSFKGIDGFIMEYSFTDIFRRFGQDKDPEIKMTCVKVEEASLPDELFTIPEGYEIMTWDEFRKGAKIEYH